MPIQVQCCGLLLTLILMFLYKKQKTIKLRTEKAFMRAFVMTIISVFADILSCVAISFNDSLPVFLVNLVCKIYLVTLLGQSFFALLYICTDLYTDKDSYRRKMTGYGVFALATSVLILILPIYIYSDKTEGVLYSYGPSAYATYIFAFLTFIQTVVKMIREKGKLTAGKRMSVLMWPRRCFSFSSRKFF